MARLVRRSTGGLRLTKQPTPFLEYPLLGGARGGLPYKPGLVAYLATESNPRCSGPSKRKAGNLQSEVVRGLRTRNREKCATRAYAAQGADFAQGFVGPGRLGRPENALK